MDRRYPARHGTRGGDRISPRRASWPAIALGAGAAGIAGALTVDLTLAASPSADGPIALLGSTAAVLVVAGVVARSAELITAALALLGASYAVLLAVDSPTLDARAAVVGAGLLAIGELAHLAIEARSTVTRGEGAMARRIGTLGVIVLVALLVGGMLTTLVDLLRTGGLGVEIVGTAAAAAAVGLLVSASRSAAGDARTRAVEIEKDVEL